jgi:phosphatidylserine decarboxylase
MTESDQQPSGPPEPLPMPLNIVSIQPGGGKIMDWELQWGRLRRWRLKTFHPRYVKEMRSRLRGKPVNCPPDVIDSRDLKFHRNIAGCWFEPEDDPFAWRRSIPYAIWGLGETVVFAGPAFLVGWTAWTYLPGYWCFLGLPFLIFGLLILWFFRSPHPLPPTDKEAVTSPADGKIVAIENTAHNDFGHLAVVKISIFLSVFDCHATRAPASAKAVRLKYKEGKFLDARTPASEGENESFEVGFATSSPPYQRYVVRQIAGAVARRIVCDLRPGQEVARGERFGMIKFGSRTELWLAKDGLELDVRVGDYVVGGSTVIGKYVDAAPTQA